MPIEFRCTSCGKLLRTGDNTAGRQAKCPQCGAVVMIPTAPSGQPAAAPGPTPPMFPPAPREPINPFQSPQAPAMAAPGAAEFGPIQPTPLDLNDVFSRSWAIFKSQLGMCLGVVLVAWLTPVGINWVINTFAQVASTATGNPQINLLVQLLAFIPMQLLTLYFYMGMIRMLLKIARGQHFDFAELFAVGPQFWPFIGVVILLGLAYGAAGMVVGVPTFIAIVSLSHPAGPQAMVMTIVIAMGVAFLFACLPAAIVGLFFAQAPYLVLDRQVPVLESFGVSKNLMAGNKGTLFLIWLLEFLLGIGGLMACGVGVLAVVPFVRLMDVVVYLTLIGDKAAAPQPGEQPV